MTQQNLAVSKPRVDDTKIWDIVAPLLGHQAMLVAYNLKMFPLLDQKPLTLSDIAEALNLAPRPTEAILNVCVAMELIQVENGLYSLTPLAEDYLLERSPSYFGGFLDLVINNYSAYSYETLKESVLTDSPRAYGDSEVFPTHEEQVALAQGFTHAMHGHSMAPALVWPSMIDLTDHNLMLDIGGGSGAHAIGATMQFPNLQAIVLDMLPVCDAAQTYIDQYNLSDRVSTHAADMWADDFPKADLHLYSLIFHDWPPEKGAELAQKSFASLPSGGRIMVQEMLYNDQKTGPLTVASYNVPMLLWMKGQGFSGPELENILRDAGFVDVETKPTFGYWSIVMGRKPS
ncbi:methyltransferase [Anaerolineales bacterium HSG6]|nr:methyltransferase [Anaerolineales bacterium HSG6]